MNSRMSPILQSYTLNDQLMKRAVAGLADTDLSRRIEPNGNSVLWVVGHIVAYRYSQANLVGLSDVWEHKPLFARGAKVEAEAAYPNIGDIMSAYDLVSPNLSQRLEALTDAELDAELTEGFPITTKTLIHGLAFMVWHEAYHVGQMAYQRRLLGGDQLVG